MNTKFFTGKGDGGTSKIGGKSVPKSDPVFVLLGDTDELISYLGLAKVEAQKAGGKNEINIVETIQGIQEMLFVFQAEVACVAFGYPLSGKIKLKEKHTEELENVIRNIDTILPSITQFTIPGGTALSALLDVTRALARKVERNAILYHAVHPVPPHFLAFLNRLSSVLFALARYADFMLGISESHPTYE